ncbi:MAG: YraN family protein [Chloracidobacterium sp. CP2_5A]|nr:MAG: YraN family protein [Chloracidobacterium sp. CP2_5A]
MTQAALKTDFPQSNPRDLGRRGEDLATQFLIRYGMQVVARNARVPIGRTRSGARIHGEIDIVAFDGPTLTFVEVKTRAALEVAAPESAVTAGKQRRLRRAARRYRALIGPADAPYRFDVVTVAWPAASAPTIQLFKGYFHA